MSIFLGICTFVLILTSVILILLVLAQKAKSDGGMGAAMGGGVAEATFGADTGNVLSKATINASIDLGPSFGNETSDGTNRSGIGHPDAGAVGEALIGF